MVETDRKKYGIPLKSNGTLKILKYLFYEKVFWEGNDGARKLPWGPGMYELPGGPRIKAPRYFGFVKVYVPSLGRKITLKTPNTLNPVTMVTHLFYENQN